MNIFYLDHHPEKAARYHCDKHVVKMILESAQLLSTAWHVLEPDSLLVQDIYKPTHANHPCAVWVRERFLNYCYTHSLATALCDEYTFRYGKTHASAKIIRLLTAAPEPLLDHNICGMTTPALAVPDQYKVLDPVSAYRQYYLTEKASLLKYTRREAPDWVRTKH